MFQQDARSPIARRSPDRHRRTFRQGHVSGFVTRAPYKQKEIKLMYKSLPGESPLSGGSIACVEGVGDGFEVLHGELAHKFSG
jgi:hypothetical protein